jgi:formiminotetrahydrofolate cyclodeaminase
MVAKMSTEKDEFDAQMKKKFSRLSNAQLVQRINNRFSRGLNDDDEVYEMCRRSEAGKLKFKVNFDTYTLIE